jgi:hypothetical protein
MLPGAVKKRLVGGNERQVVPYGGNVLVGRWYE